ncbi:MAG: hypothetical protein ACM3H7_07360 [Acidobacteriaceae bacterium]
MADIICPLCGKPNPEELVECQFCQAPLKVTGFIASPEDQAGLSPVSPAEPVPTEGESQVAQPGPTPPPEQSIPDWLKQTEASFLKPSEFEHEELTSKQLSEQIDALINSPGAPAEPQQSAIDDEWLASLLSEAGAIEAAQQEEVVEEQAVEPGVRPTSPAEEETAHGEEPPAVPAEKPTWLSDLEASSNIKLEGGMQPSETPEPEVQESGGEETGDTGAPRRDQIPDWISKVSFEAPSPQPQEPEPAIEPAEIPGWLEALRPSEKATPTAPVEDVSAADVVTAGPLVGLRGVISAHPSAIQARKPPTYSIKLRVTDEQRARVQMMQELLEEEQKPKPLTSKRVISSQNIFRIAIALVLILPIAWMIIAKSQRTAQSLPGNIPGVIEFSQQVQRLPAGVPVLLAFDYEPGFSGELNRAVLALLSQLMANNAYLTMVTSAPSGVALAESLVNEASSGAAGNLSSYTNYTDLGYIPGGTMGLLGLATSPKTVLPYSLDGMNVWASTPLSSVSRVTDFGAVIVITNDPDTARAWIEQVGTVLRTQDKPLLIVTSSQAEPLVRPYYEAVPSQVQGMVAGLAGGLAYSLLTENPPQNGLWDAYSIGVTMSILIILVGSIISVAVMLKASAGKKED